MKEISNKCFVYEYWVGIDDMSLSWALSSKSTESRTQEPKG